MFINFFTSLHANILALLNKKTAKIMVFIFVSAMLHAG